MNKEKVIEIVNEVIGDKLTQMLEEMSTNEFLDMITDKLEESGIEIENEDDEEEVRDIVGSRVLPLLHKIGEYLIGKNIPTE